VRTRLAGGDLAGPANQHGDAHTPFMKRAFEAAQWAGTVEEEWIAASFAVRAVIAAEEDDGVVVEPQILQFLQQLADVAIQTGDHGSVVSLRLRQFSLLYGSSLGTSMPSLPASLLACGIVKARYRKNGPALFFSMNCTASSAKRSWEYWARLLATPFSTTLPASGTLASLRQRNSDSSCERVPD